MKSFKDLLLNHKIPGVRLSEIRHICAETTSNMLGVQIKPSQVDYHEGEVSFKVAPVIKSEILLRQEELRAAMVSQGVKVSLMR